MRTFFLFLFSSFSIIILGQSNVDEKPFRAKIDSIYFAEDASCGNLRIGVSKQNKFREDWTIKSNEKSFIYQINYYKDSTVYMELFHEYEGKLIFASLSEDYVPINSFDQHHWSCNFYVKDDAIISFISLGHGPTENPEWEPESIFKIFKRRKSEFQNMKK